MHDGAVRSPRTVALLIAGIATAALAVAPVLAQGRKPKPPKPPVVTPDAGNGDMFAV
mgnify:CR=1 FL=1